MNPVVGIGNQPHFTALPVQQYPSRTRGTEKYKKILFQLGIAEVVLGGICCFFGILAIVVSASTRSYYSSFSYVAQGIWCGALLLATGIIALRAKVNPTKCLYNAIMTMSIITSVAMGVLVILSSFGAVIDSGAVSIFHIVISISGFAGFIISILQACYCCAGVCCYKDGHANVPYNVAYVPQQQMVPVQYPNGQVVFYSANPNAPVVQYGGPVQPTFAAGQIHTPQQQSLNPQPQQQHPVATTPVPQGLYANTTQLEPSSSHDPPPYTNAGLMQEKM